MHISLELMRSKVLILSEARRLAAAVVRNKVEQKRSNASACDNMHEQRAGNSGPAVALSRQSLRVSQIDEAQAKRSDRSCGSSSRHNVGIPSEHAGVCCQFGEKPSKTGTGGLGSFSSYSRITAVLIKLI